MRKEREVQMLQRNVQELSDTLLNLVNTINVVMDNQNNLNRRLVSLEKLTAGQQTLKAVRDCGHLGERKCDFDPPESDFDFSTEEETHS